MAKFKPGESGNPSGRPAGTGLQKRLRDSVGDKFDDLVDTVVTAALGGDMAAASLLLSRLVPAMRPIQEPQAFPMSGDTLTDKALSVLDAVSQGSLSASDGKLLLDGLAGVVRVQDGEILSKQVDQLHAIIKADKERRKA